MGPYPVALSTAISADVTEACGLSLDELLAMPAIPPDASTVVASCYSLSASLFKKFLPDETSSQDLAAKTKFLSVNSAAGTWELKLNTSLDEELYGTFKQELYKFFYPSGFGLLDSLDTIFLNGKCGPGSSIDAPLGDFYSKMFSSRLTCTSPGLIKHYETNTLRFPLWSDAEFFRQDTYGKPRVVDGSRLSFVPKNDKISRLICTEPTLNMFYQLGCGALIERRLKSYFRIDLSTQPDWNRGLVRAGSRDDSWCSIDLESASDSISLNMLRGALPRGVYDMLMLLRSCQTEVQGEAVHLNMVSTMGNGFTFPLQTAIFACAVKSAYMSLGLRRWVHVFGDDLVIRKNAKHRVLRMLQLLGFRVNADKSFFEGPFRESCGHDYYNGVNIRGVYVKRLSTLQDSYATLNALVEFTARTGVLLRHACSLILSRVNRDIQVPVWEDPSSGIRIPLSLKEKRVLCKKTHSTLYEYYSFKPRMIKIGDGYIRTPFGIRKIIYNPSGLHVALLSGMALSRGLPLRKSGRWERRRRSCSFWDTFESGPTLRKRGFSWQRWNSAVYFNLND